MSIHIEVNGLKEIVAAFKNAPSIAAPIFADGINASMAEIHKNSTDENFQFKTPRSLRTGFLEKSFADNITLATPQSLVGRIGPNVEYANAVYTGIFKYFTIAPNHFMDRIRDVSQNNVDKIFKDSIDLFTKKLTQ